MADWKEEFGEDYEVPAEIHERYKDLSWHNESSPNFTIVHAGDPEDGMPQVSLFVEHPDPSQREISHMTDEPFKRYSVMEYSEFPDVVSALDTEDFQEALARCDELIAKYK